MLVSLLILLVLMLVLYFAIFLPARRRTNNHAVMLGSLKRGSEVYTEDGIHATVARLKGERVVLECFPDKEKLELDAFCVTQLVGFDKDAELARMKENARAKRMNAGKKK